MAGLWFSLGTPVSSTNKTDHHDITEILLKVELNTITLTQDKEVNSMCLFHVFITGRFAINGWAAYLYTLCNIRTILTQVDLFMLRSNHIR